MCKLKVNQGYCAGFMWEIDTEKSKLTYVHSGLEHAYLCRNGDLSHLGKGGFPIGMDITDSYEQGIVDLKKGDFIFIASDGISDSKNDKGNAYGYDSIKTFIKQTYKQKEFKALLKSELEKFQGQSKQVDDVTALMIHC